MVRGSREHGIISKRVYVTERFGKTVWHLWHTHTDTCQKGLDAKQLRQSSMRQHSMCGRLDSVSAPGFWYRASRRRRSHKKPLCWSDDPGSAGMFAKK